MAWGIELRPVGPGELRPDGSEDSGLNSGFISTWGQGRQALGRRRDAAGEIVAGWLAVQPGYAAQKPSHPSEMRLGRSWLGGWRFSRPFRTGNCWNEPRSRGQRAPLGLLEGDWGPC